MKPTENQRVALLSLADSPARLIMGRYYRLEDGQGAKIETNTAASLVRHGWVTVDQSNAPDFARLLITPEGLSAVESYL